MDKKSSSALNGSILLSKRELLHLCHMGSLRVLTSRVCVDSTQPDRLFAVGLSASPLDVDNCCVVGIRIANRRQRTDESAIKSDLFLLEAFDIQTIAPIKKVDAESLVDLIDSRYQKFFIDPIEKQWQSWMKRESVRIHRRSFERLIKWSGQKELTRTESARRRVDRLLAVSIGNESSGDPDEKDLALRFLAKVQHLAEALGSGVGSVTSAFDVMNAWEKLIGLKPGSELGSGWEKVSGSLLKRSSEALSLEGLKRGALLGKIRKRQRSFAEAYDQEVQPIMMSYCLSANYRIIGDVFTVDEFSEAVRAIRTTEKSKAAWLYTLFVASRLEPDVIFLQTTSSEFLAPKELFPPVIDS